MQDNEKFNRPWQSTPYVDSVQDFRRQDTQYTSCRADHDQGPHRYPVLEVGPMVRSVTLLTINVTLSLERPHSSCKDARPEALAGTKSPPSSGTTHADRFTTLERGGRGKEKKKKKEKKREQVA